MNIQKMQYTNSFDRGVEDAVSNCCADLTDIELRMAKVFAQRALKGIDDDTRISDVLWAICHY